MDVYFGDSSYLKLQRHDGHLFLKLLVIFANSNPNGVEASFILDTGAYMTVISRGMARRFGYDKLPKTPASIFGYSGGVSADFVRIPSLKVLDDLLTDVPVLIPHSNDYKQNILGLNVLDYFNYYISSEDDRLYFKRNPMPKVRKELACGGIFAVHDD